MKRIIFMLVVVLCIHISVRFDVEADNTAITQLIAQVHDPSVPLQGKTLEAIALVTYDVLVNVPFVGVQDSQADLESLIALKMTLEKHTGVLERLLAVRMQQAIDRAIGIEVTRRAVHLLNVTVIPPYLVDSVKPETVTELLRKNDIEELEQIQYIRTLNGRFAKFCRSKNFSVDDFLTGVAARDFPSDLRQTTSNFQASSEKTTDRIEKSTLEDILFMSILTTIDQAKDIRIWCDILLNEEPASHKILRQQIEQKLTSHPNYRISDGERNSSYKVFSTANYIRGEIPEEYPRMLTLLFLPYLRNTDDVKDKIREVFFIYTGKQQEIDFLPAPGAWLELAE